MPWIRIAVRPLGPPASERVVELSGSLQSFGPEQLLVDDSLAAQLVELVKGADPEFDLLWDGLRFQRCCVLHRIVGTGTVVEYIDFQSDEARPNRGS
jgi:hypothetical protein